MSGDDSTSSSLEITLCDVRDQMEHVADQNEDNTLPGVFGESKIFPRVGDEYQALIPDLKEGNEISNPYAVKVNEAMCDLLPVLPIPLVWASNKSRDEEERAKALCGHADPYTEKNHGVLNTENGSIKAEQTEDASANHGVVSDIRQRFDWMDRDVALSEETEKQQTKREKNLYPLPGTPDEPWNDFECASFLLALYIFGKDLYLVKKFVETKMIGDVVSYYYGPFYKCNDYQRWAKCLRSRSKKSIHGEKIFTRRREVELFSRLNWHISKEASTKLLEVAKTFKGEGLSFVEYVFTLKDIVGTKLLIEAVAIGKGKKDLTGIAPDGEKVKRSLSASHDKNQDKGLSSLSCGEISEQLTSSRLSKNKSNELFWEAVWPRLLAGGWHSEQPKDHGISTLKHQLVFLMPGIKKFRRNKLVKGKDYFDSVSDVLNKVASDPRIIELEEEKEKDSGDEENHSDEQELKKKGLSNGKRHGYLQVCKTNKARDKMELAVVDTSKPNGFEVRRMKILTTDSADMSSPSSACSGTGSDSSSDKSDSEGEATQLKTFLKYGSGRKTFIASPGVANGISLVKHKFHCNDAKLRSSKKPHVGGKVNAGPKKYVSPLKRPQVNEAKHEDSSLITEKKKDRPFIICLSNRFKVNEMKEPLKGPHVKLLSSKTSPGGSESSHLSPPSSSHKLDERIPYIICESSREEDPPEQSLSHVFIDLKVSWALEDVGNNHGAVPDVTCPSSLAENTSLPRKPKPKRRNIWEDFSPSLPKSSKCKQQPSSSMRELQHLRIHQDQEQQTDMTGVRQSTRNRPLTAKALEAFETSSFFELKRKRKSEKSTMSRASRRNRGIPISNSTSDSAIASNEMEGNRIDEESTATNFNHHTDDGSFTSAGNSGEGDEVHRQQHKLQVSAAATRISNGSVSQPPVKKKRNLPGTPDPTADVIALSPTTLMATNRFVCEICNKGFQRDQNLQLHRRGHNLPWKLRQRTSTEVKKRVYICPEPSCVHHNPSRALGDLTGIKKHFSRKHGEKKWKCDKCSKKYAVQSDWKAHQKTCGTREYNCDCGTIFSRRDSFITHRAFCDALAEENNKVNQGQLESNMAATGSNPNKHQVPEFMPCSLPELSSFDPENPLKSIPQELVPLPFKPMMTSSHNMFSTNSGTLFPNQRSHSSSTSNLQLSSNSSTGFGNYLQDSKQFGGLMPSNAYTSATALLQKATQMGATASNTINSPMMQKSYNVTNMAGPDQMLGQPGCVPTFDNHQQQHHIQSQQVSQQKQMFGTTSQTSVAMNEQMSMFSGLFMNGGNDHQGHIGLFKGLEQEDTVSANSGTSTGINMVRPGMNMSDRSMSAFGGNGDLIPTVDFLGVGGSRPSNLHEKRQQQQQRLVTEAMNHQQRVVHQGMNTGIPFEQQDMGKPLWDV